MMRTHRAGDLRAERRRRRRSRSAAGSRSRRDHGGKVFLDVRDAAGLVQVVVDPAAAGLEVAHRVRNEWVCGSTATVRPRPEGTVNADLPTGEVEVGRDARSRC